MAILREQMLQTATQFISAFNTNTPEGLIAHRSPVCQQRFVPVSAGHPTLSNAEYQAMMAPGFLVMKNFHLKLAEGTSPLVDEVNRKVVLHLTSSAESPLGLYTGEYMFILGMSEDGELIESIVEFFDSATVADFRPRMLKWMEDNKEALAGRA